MVSALDSGANGPGSSPSRGHCVLFLGKTTGWRSACACAVGVGEMFKAFVRASYWLYQFQFFSLFFTWKHQRIHRSSFQ